MKKLLFCLSVLCLAGCAKEARPTNDDQLAMKDVAIKSKQKVENRDLGVSLLLDSVLNDSRCPIDVNCIWQGNAAVRFILEYKGTASPFVMNTGIPPVDTLINGFKIKLIKLSPDPISGIPINQSDYSAEVDMTRN